MTIKRIRDYYEILGVARNATAEEIKRAFRKQALKYHPDRDHEDGAEERFKEVNEAYETLSNPEKRATYDAQQASYPQAQVIYGSHSPAWPAVELVQIITDKDTPGWEKVLAGAIWCGGLFLDAYLKAKIKES